MEISQANWIESLRKNIDNFLQKMSDDYVPGYYCYSLTGDYFSSKTHWGLGNSVFAAKILYMLDTLTDQKREDIFKFIVSFQDAEGYISDPLIAKASRFYRWKYALRTMDFSNFFNEQTRRAETRQAFAALRSLGRKPKYLYRHIPYSPPAIRKYVNSLDWTNPWGAASHVSHLVFFLHNNRILFKIHEKETDKLIDYVFEVANHYRQNDGSWYAPGEIISMTHRINAAMKMMIAYGAAERNDFSHPEKLIDMCLSTINKGDACNNFNIICVLYNCSNKTNYRIYEVRKYCRDQLDIYRNHYWLQHGGFSFYERNANNYYYGGKISEGLQEPDIHATVLFLWGIVLISKIFRVDNELGFKLPIT
ncbi:MAG: hypothetical protein C4567_04570 [Deltaproteobacteria bacterium]|nr:MAG: hypothetical protein C4567_04570 [Deltaproteobacteria bacterium]